MTRTVATLLAFLALLATPAAAEHEIYYRYTVLGYVMDGAGRPLTAEPVEIVRDKTGLAYRKATDNRGFYLVVLRLGDESAGEALTFHAGVVTAHVRARFDAANHADERGTRIDVDGARVVERPAWFRSTLADSVAGRNDLGRAP